MAAMEQETRQAAGIAAARERGIYRGRKPGSTKANRERVLELRQTGLTVAEVAAACGISRRSVLRYSAGA